MMGTGRYPYRKGFHWKDNWYFTRLPHGVVSIAKFASPEDEEPEFEIEIPAEQWRMADCLQRHHSNRSRR